MSVPLFSLFTKKETSVAVVGLGYVGLPLAVHLSRHFSVIGFDVNSHRIDALRGGSDSTGEVPENLLKESPITYTDDPSLLKQAQCIIIAVPTPVSEDNVPDMSLVEKASVMVGSHMSTDTVVVYESTVYPGATEEICLPILEKTSGLVAGKDFFVGYSPERINPGDKEHTIDRVTKVVSAMDEASTDLVASVYGAITSIHRAPSIKVAEAAKVIENTQRDINIALMNELALIFARMHISTYDVLAAAGTKWNFLPFTPGLVGGHCIGVDPYYLTYKAQQLGYDPKVILSGRQVNDGMHLFLQQVIMRHLSEIGRLPHDARVVILGATFKENIPDVRNSRIMLLHSALQQSGIHVDITDPFASAADVLHEYGVQLTPFDQLQPADVVVCAVQHAAYKALTATDFMKFQKGSSTLVMDIKCMYDRHTLESAGFVYWTF